MEVALLSFAVGLITGAIALKIYLEARSGQVLAEGLSQAKSSEAAAQQRASDLQERLATLNAQLQDKQRELQAQALQLTQALSSLQEQQAIAQRVPVLESKLTEKERTLEALHETLTKHKAQEATFVARVAEFERAQQQLKNAFAELATTALQRNNELFLAQAKAELEKQQLSAQSENEKRAKSIEELVKPIKEGLEKYDHKIAQFEKERTEAYGALTVQLKTVAQESQQLKSEAAKIVNALRAAPSARGRWGEMELTRVVELAGMSAHVSFEQQVHVVSEDGNLRPDMLVRLPGGKSIVVDAKVSAKAYFEAFEETEEARRHEKIDEHVCQVRTQMSNLGAKAYWEQFEPTPEFVVMFMPEPLFRAALERDPALLEDAMKKKVVLATPMTLLALLKAVAYGWRQEQVADNARQISELGKRLYEAIVVFSSHMDKVRVGLDRAAEGYNAAIGSLEKNVFVCARKFKDLGAVAEDQLKEARTLAAPLRTLQAPESRPLLLDVEGQAQP